MSTSKSKNSVKSKSESVKIDTVKTEKVDSNNKTIKNDLSKLSKIENFKDIVSYYDIAEDELKLHIVAGKIIEVLESYLKLIQQIVQPEEFYALYESNGFDDAYKAKLMLLYKRIIVMHREILKSELLHDDEFYIKTISSAHKLVIDVKPQILEILNKMQDSWKPDSKKDLNKGLTQYFG